MDLPGPGARCTEGQVEPGGNGCLISKAR